MVNIKRLLPIVSLFALAAIGFLFWASFDVDSGVYVKCLCNGSENRRCVALTFDDGPDEVMTPKVLDVLKKYNLKATFFVIGKKAERNPELISRIINEGHIIGGHSWTHTCDFPLKSSAEIYNELLQCEESVYNITGKRMVLFRPPFGVTNPLIAEAVAKKECTCIGWSVRSLDTNESKDRKDINNRIVQRLHNGAIILLHDRCEKADELLQLLISDLFKEGYDIINLDEMLDIELYRANI